VLLTQGQNALLLDNPLDSDALADLLKQVYSDATLRKTLSDGAVAFAAQHLWSQQAVRLDAIYQSVKKLGT
jgi:glycosyltransferase involved in cell wall biosynthesis